MSAAIVILEDNPLVRAVFEAVLTRRGYRPHFAQTPEEAERLIGETGPALVILDLVLPQGSGFDLIDRLAAHGAGAPPVLAVTNYAGAAEVERLRRAGAAGCLEKPVAPEALIRAVEALT